MSTEDEVMLDGYENRHPAQVLTCHCNTGDKSDIFYYFWPYGLNHNHVACANCSQHFCLFNICQLPDNPPLMEEEYADYAAVPPRL